MDKGLRGHWKNSPSHLSLILAGYFQSFTLKVNILHASVMFGREVFGELIGNIFSSLLLVEAELVFLDVTSHPVEAHVKCFGAFPAHVSGEDAVVGCVFSLYRSGRLRMAHLNQVRADGNSLLSVEEDRTGLGLGSICHDGADGLALGEDRAVWSRSSTDGGGGGLLR